MLPLMRLGTFCLSVMNKLTGDSGNIFASIPGELPEEVFETLLCQDTLRIERIVSKGHCSEPEQWYDQAQGEWVILLRGHAVLTMQDGSRLELNEGDYLNIPPHTRHRLEWTDPEQETVWLAIWYGWVCCSQRGS